MSLEPAAIRLLRETLEERLTRREAAAILFEALSDWGPRVPGDRTELADVIHGPLRKTLERRLLPDAAHAILRRVERLLITADAPTGKHGMPKPVSAADLFPDERSTDELPNVDGAAYVLVLSATEELAVNLAACVVPFAVRVENAHSLRALADATAYRTDIVVLDCKLPPVVDNRVLVKVLAGLGGIPCVLWGSDLAAGSELLSSLEGSGVRAVSIPLSSGVAPLIDLVLSRAPPR